jgi:nucleotide-binding universal stress UspA family protein
MGSGPVVIAYDGSPAAERAIREAGALLGKRPAVVVVVWKPGLGWELMELPSATLGLPPAPIDVRTALEIDEKLAERSQLMAQHGAELAKEAGFDAEGLAIAEEVEVTIAETIVGVARQRDAQAVVVGAHGHSRLGEVVLGSTSRDVIRNSSCPTVVVSGVER